MPLQEGVHSVRINEFPRIVEIWEASVRSTHHFISEADIQRFRPRVLDSLPYLLDHGHLACVREIGGEAVGFIGVTSVNVDMLFVHPEWRGMGVGRRLLQYAEDFFGATTLDVHEQNEQALGFYRQMGYVVTGRSERDGTGKPYPMLHMVLRRIG